MYITERHEIKQILQQMQTISRESRRADLMEQGQESRRGGRGRPCHWRRKKAEKGQRILVDIALKCVLF